MHIVLASSQPWAIDLADLEIPGQRLTAAVQSPVDLVAWLARSLPDVVVLDYPPEVLGALIHDVVKRLPRAAIAVVCAAPTSEQLLDYIGLGVADVLVANDGQTIRQFLVKLDERGRAASLVDRDRARRLAFLAAKGGDGASFALSNYAVALAAAAEGRVLVIDLSLPFGDVDVYLEPDPIRHDLLDFVESADRLDNALLRAMVCEVAPNLDVIPSPGVTEKILKLDAAGVSRLIDAVEPYYGFILIDLGAAIDHIGVRIAERIDRFFLVARRDLPSARRASHMLRLLSELEVADENIAVVVNGYGRAGVDLAEFEKAVGHRIECALPDAGANAQMALARGVSVMTLAPRSPFARAIESWVEDMAGARQKGRSLWRIFGRK